MLKHIFDFLLQTPLGFPGSASSSSYGSCVLHTVRTHKKFSFSIFLNYSVNGGTRSTRAITCRRIGRVLIAQGRDAADVPITHTFGPNTLVSFKVWTDEAR
jgi:hypothetical protein